MNKRHKALIIFLSIITLGIYLIVIKKRKNIEVKETLIEEKIPFKIETLITALGGLQNISSVSAITSRIKINFNDRSMIDIEKIKKIKAISGLVLQTKSISCIVGYSAPAVATAIEGELNGN